MREKLIEILKNDPCDSIPTDGECVGCPYEPLLHQTKAVTEDGANCICVAGSCFEARYADYLLAKGLFVPPVDIGQKVWYIEGGYYNSANLKPKEIEVTEISKKKCGKTIDWAFIANRTRYKFSSIGKSVFLDRPSCEAEIARRKAK